MQYITVITHTFDIYEFEFFRLSFGLLYLFIFFPEAPPAAQERRTRFYCLIGVLRLCAGNDRLDVLSLGDIDPELRGVLRRRTRFYTMDDHGRAILARPQTRRHVHRGSRQLDS